MKELLFAGRGGEGLVLASQILADALARAGYYVQSFPEFKAERRGAPISAFLRWDEKPIHRRYKVRDCDVLAVVSPAPPTQAQLAALRPGGLLLLNRERRLPVRGGFATARVPAARIAREHGILSPEGRPLGNVAVLGACARLLLPEGGLALLEEAVRARTGAHADANLAAARDGWILCTRQRPLPGDLVVEHLPAIQRSAFAPPHAEFPVSSTGSDANATGAWALAQPVFHEACSACGVCALFCPEGVVTRSADGTAMIFDAAHCKGCGICTEVCPVHGALVLEEVHA